MPDVRDRISNRVNRNRLKLEVKRSVRGAVILSLAIVAGLAGAAWIISKVDPNLIDSSHQVQFAVDNATGVIGGLDPVRFEGIQAGKIDSDKLVDGHAIITVSVENSFGPIYKDATAELRPNSALEDMYLDITNRGQPGAGLADPNVPIAAGQTATSVNVDDVLGVFDTDTRDQLRELLSNLGNGLADHGAQLQEAFVDAMPLVEVAGKITRQLAQQPQLTRQLVHNANVLTADLGQRNTQLRTLVNYASQTLGTLQASSPNLAATLQDLPGTLHDVNSSFTATMGVLGRVNSAVTALEPVAANLTNGLNAVQGLATSAQPAVGALQNPITQLVPLADDLRPLSRNLDASVQRLGPQVPVLDRAVRDLAECKQGIDGFFQWDASMTKFGDVHGSVPRGNLLIGLTAAGLNSPDEAAEAQCDAGAPIGDANPTIANAH